MLTLLGCVKQPTPEEAERKRLLTKHCAALMSKSVVPVFMASSVAFFVMELVEYTVESSHDGKEALNASLSFLSAFVVFIGGKLITWALMAAEREAKLAATEDRAVQFNAVIDWLRREKLSHCLVHFVAELSGFLLKDFIVVMVLELVYGEHGFGPAFGVWVLLAVAAPILVRLAAYVLRRMRLSIEEQAAQLDFDTDSWALGFAYAFTVLLAQGSAGCGFTYISPSSYVYSYEDDYDDEGTASNSYTYLYIWVTMVFVACLLLIEEKLGIGFRVKGDARRNISVDMQEQDMVDNSSIELRHKVYGCFCGLSWFILIVDNLGHIFGNGTLAHLIGIALVAIFFTRNAPSFLAGKLIQAQNRNRRLENIQQERNAQEEAPGCWSHLVRWYHQVGVKRSQVSFVAFRLALGWVWEVVITQIFMLIAGTGVSKEDEVAIAFASMVVAVLLSYGVLRYTRDWEAAELAAEAALQELRLQEQQLQEQEIAAVMTPQQVAEEANGNLEESKQEEPEVVMNPVQER